MGSRRAAVRAALRGQSFTDAHAGAASCSCVDTDERRRARPAPRHERAGARSTTKPPATRSSTRATRPIPAWHRFGVRFADGGIAVPARPAPARRGRARSRRGPPRSRRVRPHPARSCAPSSPGAGRRSRPCSWTSPASPGSATCCRRGAVAGRHRPGPAGRRPRRRRGRSACTGRSATRCGSSAGGVARTPATSRRPAGPGLPLPEGRRPAAAPHRRWSHHLLLPACTRSWTSSTVSTPDASIDRVTARRSVAPDRVGPDTPRASAVSYDAPVRVLVVEDEAKMASLVKRALEREGYAVDVAGTGTDALWLATENEYDAIVLDVMIPPPNGFEVCRELRARRPLGAGAAAHRPRQRRRPRHRSRRRRRRLPRRSRSRSRSCTRASARPHPPRRGAAAVGARASATSSSIPPTPPGDARRRGHRPEPQGVRAARAVHAAPRRGAHAAPRSSSTSGTSPTTARPTSSTSTSATCARRSTGPFERATIETVRGVGYRLRSDVVIRRPPRTLRGRLTLVFALVTVVLSAARRRARRRAVPHRRCNSALDEALETRFLAAAQQIYSTSTGRPVRRASIPDAESFAQVIDADGTVVAASPRALRRRAVLTRRGSSRARHARHQITLVRDAAPRRARPRLRAGPVGRTATDGGRGRHDARRDDPGPAPARARARGRPPAARGARDRRRLVPRRRRAAPGAGDGRGRRRDRRPRLARGS